MPRCDLANSADAPEHMQITVIVCTYNRCHTLGLSLQSIAAQLFREPRKWEVLVVDNNSKDRTRDVIAEFCAKYPGRFRYLFESNQGLSHARNAGVRKALGEILAFTDDDVIVLNTWLDNLTSPLFTGQWAGAGGPIYPEGGFVPPSWLQRDWPPSMAPLAMFDAGPVPRDLTEPCFGANMAFRRSVFDRRGLFRTDLGRCGDSLLSNEDSEFGRRLLEAGERLRYEPAAVVYHPVEKKRIQKNYFLAWWFAKGRADIREVGIEPGAKWYFAGVPLVFFRRLVIQAVRWIVTIQSARRFSCKVSTWTICGQILEARRLRRNARRTLTPPLKAYTVRGTDSCLDKANWEN